MMGRLLALRSDFIADKLPIVMAFFTERIDSRSGTIVFFGDRSMTA
jgi:hypothetical protein